VRINVDTPDDFIEAEIKKILAILDKHCEHFSVDKIRQRKELGKELNNVEESEPSHANG
jgi:hypothetical protein